MNDSWIPHGPWEDLWLDVVTCSLSQEPDSLEYEITPSVSCFFFYILHYSPLSFTISLFFPTLHLSKPLDESYPISSSPELLHFKLVSLPRSFYDPLSLDLPPSLFALQGLYSYLYYIRSGRTGPDSLAPVLTTFYPVSPSTQSLPLPGLDVPECPVLLRDVQRLSET